MTPLIGDIPNQTDKFTVFRAKRSNIIPFVILIVTWECLAPTNRRSTVFREDLLDALIIIGIDNGRHVEVVAVEAVPGYFSEHAGDVLGAGRDGVPVPNPGVGEGGGLGAEAGHGERGDVGVTSVGAEVDGAVGGVLVDEVDRVCGGYGCERGGCEKEGGGELHLD